MSKLFGLDQALVLSSARRLVGPSRSNDLDLPSVFARSVWSRLAEPGDRVAGAVVAAIGPVDALTALLDGTLQRAIRTVGQPHLLAPDLPTSVSATRSGPTPDLSLTTAIDRWLPRLNSAEVLRAVEAASSLGASLVAPEHPDWPTQLNDLEFHAPLALWVRGSVEHLDCPSVSIVGSRAATGYGEHVTADFSGGLVSRGINVVSGGAYGIDGMAHRAALAGNAPTTAVLAGGVDRLYPSGHDDLLRRIIAQGAVVSELPPGFSPTKWRFLQRNRLIAALSAATLVCEAGTRSGSLNTAAHASSLGRSLGAVPGPITSAASAGCHRLLREFDAACVASVEDLCELFWGIQYEQNRLSTCVDQHTCPTEPIVDQDSSMQSSEVLTNQRRSATSTRLLDALRPRAPRTIIDLARETGLDPASVRAGLGELFAEGRAQEHERGWTRGPAVSGQERQPH